MYPGSDMSSNICQTYLIGFKSGLVAGTGMRLISTYSRYRRTIDEIFGLAFSLSKKNVLPIKGEYDSTYS